MDPATALEVRDLSVHYSQRGRLVPVVHGIAFRVFAREILGLVGESGCGKTATALAILRLIPRRLGCVEGVVVFEGRDLVRASDREMARLRGRKIALIPQDPMASLDPVFSIGSQVSEVFRYHDGSGRRESWAHAVEALRQVRITAPEIRVHLFPHQLSGGMNQRVLTAMAFGCRPAVLIADEPTTSLDVTVQAQVLGLLRQLAQDFGTGVVLITHDLGIVAQFCDRVAVMYAGRVVEHGPTRGVFKHPRHPYTRLLLEAVPSVTRPRRPLAYIAGQPPAPDALPGGCSFWPRCPAVTARCRESVPVEDAVDDEHAVSCWHAGA